MTKISFKFPRGQRVKPLTSCGHLAHCLFYCFGGIWVCCRMFCCLGAIGAYAVISYIRLSLHLTRTFKMVCSANFVPFTELWNCYDRLRPELMDGIHFLTHWGWDKMAAIFQTFLNAFLWMKIYELQLRFHWSLFLRVQLSIFQHWFR